MDYHHLFPHYFSNINYFLFVLHWLDLPEQLQYLQVFFLRFLLLFYYYYYYCCMCVCVHVCAHTNKYTYVIAYMWGPEDNLLSFHCGSQGLNSGCQVGPARAFTGQPTYLQTLFL